MTTIGENKLTIEDIYNVVFRGKPVTISDKAMSAMYGSYEFLKEFSRSGLIYGINTGFGPMAQYRIDAEDQINLQYNLIRSHSAGSGKPLDSTFVRSLMLARLSNLSRGYSGVHPDAANILSSMINKNITPLVLEHGGVGASGDLVQLAHLALCLIGEGESFVDGKKVPTKEVFRDNDITPLKIHLREGLGLINGTSAMTGIGLVNVLKARNLLCWTIFTSCIIAELIEAYTDHYSKELNSVKWHDGQQRIAAIMQQLLSDSASVKKRADHLYEKEIVEKVIQEKVQEYYSVRCVPQILGPILDTILNAEKVTINELNSVNDNPVIDVASRSVYHGGNFHGDYVALEMDKLKLAVTKLSMLCERQLNFLMNNKLNGRLTPFVNLGVLGLNLGMQGTQFTATSTVAENQSLSSSVYIHSISCNNDNQDIVSMGTNAALLCNKVIENTYEVIAIHLITILQAVDYLEAQDRLSGITGKMYRKLRQIVPVFEKDDIMYTRINEVKNFIQQLRLDDLWLTQEEHAEAAGATATL